MDRGLTRASDAPLRSGYVQATGTWNGQDGAAGRLEAGVHPWTNVSAFVAGTVDRFGPGAEVGARWTWRW